MLLRMFFIMNGVENTPSDLFFWCSRNHQPINLLAEGRDRKRATSCGTPGQFPSSVTEASQEEPEQNEINSRAKSKKIT